MRYGKHEKQTKATYLVCIRVTMKMIGVSFETSNYTINLPSFGYQPTDDHDLNNGTKSNFCTEQVIVDACLPR